MSEDLLNPLIALSKRVDDLLRQNSDLQASNNRLLDRARDAEGRLAALETALKQSAKSQIAYWHKKQDDERFPEDATDEDGECHLRWDEALSAGRCNGAFSHAHWWRDHINTIFKAAAPLDAALKPRTNGPVAALPPESEPPHA